MKRQILAKIVKASGEKAAVMAGNKTSIALCYQPKEPKGLEKFNRK